ncbi:MAG: bifunctional hydroxymethylpyrimidine kinase/phosphomethylpyrimidine kinase [Planctomycetes bacterium]|nr:bifunctional hydroxymethylpyrimidine kinase/phosphomethylpyrimidine kinase [Planctomycetota bacterium]
MRSRFRGLVSSLGERSLGVLGDPMLDVYIYGRPDRLSREAPVIIVEFESESLVPGGAANCVANLLDLGIAVRAVGVLGDDDHGRTLRGILRERGSVVDGLVLVGGRRTVTKTRIMAGDLHTSKQQVIRIDQGPGRGPGESPVEAVLEAIERADPHVAAWVVADYGYGTVDEAVRLRMAEIARSKPVMADSRHDLLLFRGVTLVTPNEGEAGAALRETLRGPGDVARAGAALMERLGTRAVLITRGNHGMMLFEPGAAPLEIPIVGSRDIVDVSGAGDTVTSVMAAAVAAGASYPEAARLATYAASVVVMKRGTATCSRDELLSVIQRECGA